MQFLKCDVYVNAASCIHISPTSDKSYVYSDAAADVAKKYSVSAMPTFIFIKNGQKVAQVRGADPR